MKKRRTLLCLLACFLLIFTACGKTITIDGEELLDVEFGGIDGEGVVNIEVAPEAPAYIQSLVAGDKNPEKISAEEAYEIQKRLSAIYDYLDDLDYEFIGEDGGLLNGDEVAVKLIENEELAKEAGVKLKTDELKYTVEGLKEIKPIEKADLQKGFKLIYHGFSPALSIEFSNELPEEYKGFFTYDVKPKSEISKEEDKYEAGEKISITINFNPDDLAEAGYVVEGLEPKDVVKQVVIPEDKVDKVMTDLETITPEDKVQLLEYADEVMNKNYMKKNFWGRDDNNINVDNKKAVTGYALEKVVLSTIKHGLDPADFRLPYNRLSLIYSVDWESSGEDHTGHVGVNLNNLIQKPDKSFKDLAENFEEVHHTGSEPLEKILDESYRDYSNRMDSKVYSVDEFMDLAGGAGKEDQEDKKDSKSEGKDEKGDEKSQDKKEEGKAESKEEE